MVQRRYGPRKASPVVHHSVPSEPAPGSAPEQPTEDILDGIGEAFLSFDREWRITYFNRACEEFFGVPREQALGAVVWSF